MTLENEKDISCLKAFAFSIVFFSLATSILYCPTWPWAVQGSCPPYPTAFHSLRHGWQKRKKTRQTATGKGLLLSGWLCDISGDNHNKRQITARFTVSAAYPLPLPQKLVSPNEKRPCDSLETTRTRNATLGDGNCACACLLIELGTTGVLLSNIFFSDLFDFIFL